MFEGENIQKVRPEFQLIHGGMLENEDVLGKKRGMFCFDKPDYWRIVDKQESNSDHDFFIQRKKAIQ